MNGVGPIIIARRLGKNRSTVSWYMYSNGLKAPQQYDEPQCFMRGATPIHRFTRDEDEVIMRMRKDGATTGVIARSSNAIWSRGRDHRSIRRRLIMLAAIEDLTP